MSIAGANIFEESTVEGVGQTTVKHTDVDTDPGGSHQDHTHIDYDLAHKACLAEIASLFEDIQADLRIITDRADDRSKGMYIRSADTVANNPANIAAAAANLVNLQTSGILDLVNAEVGNPTDLGNTSSSNYNAIRNSNTSPGGFTGGPSSTAQNAGYGNSVPGFEGEDGTVYYENNLPLEEITPKSGTAEGNVYYAMAGSRTLPIQSELMNILRTAAQAAGVDVEITSGGQVPTNEGGVVGVNRTGSNRHDKGYAADVRIFTGVEKEKTQLFTADPEQLAIMIKFAEACRDAGATGIGMGNGYMSNGNIHVDIAWKGQQSGAISGILSNRYWGGGASTGTKTGTDNAPVYLATLMEPRNNTA